MTIRFTIPYPPSANRYWRTWKGRMLVSREARAYKTWVALRLAHVRPRSGPLALTATFYRPQKRGDLDNFVKVTLDALQGVAFENDSQVVELHLSRRDDKANPRVEVEIHPLESTHE